jgi:NAD-dependent deacetylase
MPQDKMELAYRMAEACDLCMVLGSSLVVYPAADIPQHALRKGARLMIINRDPTPLDRYAHVVIHQGIGKVMDGLLGGI